MWMFNLFTRPFKFYLFFLVVHCSVFYNLCDDKLSKFNASLRDYYNPAEESSSTEVLTLQRQEKLNDGKGFKPLNSTSMINPRHIQIQPVDNSPSFSHSRGFTYQDTAGYGDNGFDLGPYEGGGYGHHHPPAEHDPHYYYGHGYPHKYHNHHALAVKTFLWPLAGIAILGAAAALVTNPILLQLGVVTGRRKRSTTLDTTTKSSMNFFTKSTDKNYLETVEVPVYKYEAYPLVTRRHFKDGLVKSLAENPSTTPSNLPSNVLDKPRKRLKWAERRMVPIILKFKQNGSH